MNFMWEKKVVNATTALATSYILEKTKIINKTNCMKRKTNGKNKELKHFSFTSKKWYQTRALKVAVFK